MTRRAIGIGLACTTALVSGVAIYVNSYAVKHFDSATVFTTAKNAVAGLLLVAYAIRPRPAPSVARPVQSWPALVVLAVVGGSVPFVLFFEGLARAQATQAAFIQKTLVLWVALLAVPILRERIRAPHVLAICLLVAGQAWLAGSAGTVVFGSGEAMILGATLLWAVEVVYVKRLVESIPAPTLAVARMGLGGVLLVAWVVVNGDAGQFVNFDRAQWMWVVLTGLLLTAYVATWYAALARAQAVDVTAVLVLGAVVTAVLSGAADGAHVNVPGIGLIIAGAALVALAARRPERDTVPA
jgi:drug/metabolite transporter (DMT)-like permease